MQYISYACAAPCYFLVIFQSYKEPSAFIWCSRLVQVEVKLKTLCGVVIVYKALRQNSSITDLRTNWAVQSVILPPSLLEVLLYTKFKNIHSFNILISSCLVFCGHKKKLVRVLMESPSYSWKQTRSSLIFLKLNSFNSLTFFSYIICIFVILFSVSFPVSLHSFKGLFPLTGNIDLISTEYEVWGKYHFLYMALICIFNIYTYIWILHPWHMHVYTHTYTHMQTNTHIYYMVNNGAKSVSWYATL